MSEQQIIEIQQGVWIDEQWLQDAGLGKYIQVSIQPGEIRIVAIPNEEPASESSAAWDVFRSLGEHSHNGQLQDAAKNHDKYLYGKQ